MTRHKTLGGTVPTFQEITGYNIRDYVIISLPNQVHLTDERRENSIQAAIRRYKKLLNDGLPIGYHLSGEESIIVENENDPCPIGYPSKDGAIDLARIIDELDFNPVIAAYRKVQ
jgi:hypothetical protein